MPTLEETLRQQAKTQTPSKYMKLENLPDEIKLKWIKEEMKTDTKGNSCFFVTFETEEGLLLVQKYTATMFNTLADSISGREKELKETFFPYKKIDTLTYRGRTGFARVYPVRQETRKKK
jgi:hypothetical protein